MAGPEADRRRVARNIGGEFKGYRLDKERPADLPLPLGDVDIHEQPLPVLKAGGVVLVRKFHLVGKPPSAGKAIPAGRRGAKVSESSPGTWRVDDKLNVHVTAPAGAKPQLRERGIAKQVLVPIELKEGTPVDVEIEVAW